MQKLNLVRTKTEVNILEAYQWDGTFEGLLTISKWLGTKKCEYWVCMSKKSILQSVNPDGLFVARLGENRDKYGDGGHYYYPIIPGDYIVSEDRYGSDVTVMSSLDGYVVVVDGYKEKFDKMYEELLNECTFV